MLLIYYKSTKKYGSQRKSRKVSRKISRKVSRKVRKSLKTRKTSKKNSRRSNRKIRGGVTPEESKRINDEFDDFLLNQELGNIYKGDEIDKKIKKLKI